MTEEALRLARIIWDYDQQHQAPVPADVIIAIGTNDLRVARPPCHLRQSTCAVSKISNSHASALCLE